MLRLRRRAQRGAHCILWLGGAHGPHIAGHFQASQQLGVARLAAHPRFIRAVDLVGAVKARPLLGQLVTDGLLAVEAILLLLGDSGIVERDTALLGNAGADLLHIEGRHAVDDRYHELRAKRQDFGEDHCRAPYYRRIIIARPPRCSSRAAAVVPENPLTGADSDRYGWVPGLGGIA